MKKISCIAFCIAMILTAACCVKGGSERRLSASEAMQIVGGDDYHKACARTSWGASTGVSADACQADGSQCSYYGTECTQGHQEDEIAGDFWKCRPTILESTCNKGPELPCLVSFSCVFDDVLGVCVPDLNVSADTIGTGATDCETGDVSGSGS